MVLLQGILLGLRSSPGQTMGYIMLETCKEYNRFSVLAEDNLFQRLLHLGVLLCFPHAFLGSEFPLQAMGNPQRGKFLV